MKRLKYPLVGIASIHQQTGTVSQAEMGKVADTAEAPSIKQAEAILSALRRMWHCLPNSNQIANRKIRIGADMPHFSYLGL